MSTNSQIAKRVDWVKTEGTNGRATWRAVLNNGKTVIIRRELVKRSRAYSPSWICIGRKPRHYSCTTLVYVTVQDVDGTYHKLKTRHDVKEGKAAGLVFAWTGEGERDFFNPEPFKLED